MKTYQVSELHNIITNYLEELFVLPICIEGEITSFRGANSSGHYYFNIKDDSASISCVLFKGKSLNCSCLPKMGEKVKLVGSLQTYSNSSMPSKYQLIVSNIEPVGRGELFEKYLMLLDKLSAEGLFDESHKNNVLPKFLNCVGVVTSDRGEVIHDIVQTIKLRYPLLKVILYPVKVQGVGAVDDILDGLNYMQNNLDVQVVILARGGGSFEDLFVYNDENLVRFIYNMKKQVISSIGHDKDRPLCDFVADIRVSTPTAAGLAVTPVSFNEIQENLNMYEQNNLSNLEYFFSQKRQDLDYYFESIYTMFKNKISSYYDNLNSISKHIELLSYDSVLNRGFSLTTDINGDIISDVEKVKKNDEIKTILKNGEFTSIVK